MENPVNPTVPVNSEELPIASAVPPMKKNKFITNF